MLPGHAWTLKLFLKLQKCPNLGPKDQTSVEGKKIYVLPEVRGSAPKFGQAAFLKKNGTSGTKPSCLMVWTTSTKGHTTFLNSKTCSKKIYFRSQNWVKVQNVAELRAFTVNPSVVDPDPKLFAGSGSWIINFGSGSDKLQFSVTKIAWNLPSR